MVTSLSANRTRATTRVTTATLTLAAQRHQTRNALLLPPCAMSTTAAAANTTDSNARNSNAATATATLRLRQAGRTRHEVLALAHTLPLSQSHTHIALDSHSCLVLFVQLRAAKTKRRHNFVSIRPSSCSPSRSLSLFLACVAGPVGCGRARRITKTKLSTICARPFFAAVAAYLMVSVFSFSTSKIPIRQQHTHTHARTRHAHPCKRTCHVYVCLQNFHTHTRTHTQWVYFILFRYISPRLQSEIFLLEIYTHTQLTARFSVTFFHIS